MDDYSLEKARDLYNKAVAAKGTAYSSILETGADPDLDPDYLALQEATDALARFNR